MEGWIGNRGVQVHQQEYQSGHPANNIAQPHSRRNEASLVEIQECRRPFSLVLICAVSSIHYFQGGQAFGSLVALAIQDWVTGCSPDLILVLDYCGVCQ